MLRRTLCTLVPALAAGLLGLWLALPTATKAAPRPAADTWAAEGTLLESCTCAVPCSCNFGEGPSPHPYCYAVYAYRLEKGTWGGADLSGLVFGGADGPKGSIGFLDERATPAQRAALEKLAYAVFAKGGPAPGPRPFVPARITYEVKGNDLRLDIAGQGGFTARVLLGLDRKSPIIVENNTVWPIRRAIKAKALPLAFRDERAGVICGDGTNANYGAFTFTGRTGEASARSADAMATPGASCCGQKH